MIKLRAYGVEQIPDICQEAGIDRLEGSYRLFDPYTGRALERIAKRYEDAGIRFDTFHLPLAPDVDLAACYETTRRASVARTAEWIERSTCFGTRIGIQHPTASCFNVEMEGFGRLLDQLRRSLEELLPVAERHAYTIALENIGAREYGARFGSLPEHFERLSREFDHPNLGFCFDTGHGMMSLGPGGEGPMFDAMGSRLVAFHLNDNCGDADAHMAPGRGLVDWTTVFQRAAQLGFEGTMCIEASPFAPGPAHKSDAWRRLMSDTAQLAEQAVRAGEPPASNRPGA